jgi:primase-polymerase (primpol)-like protein
VRDGKRTKVPYRATGGRASTTQPDDWTTYEAAVDAEPDYDGIGFVFAGNGIVGIDLDNCLVDGMAKPWASALLSRFACTYAEISPSGVGVKVWVKGKLPTERGHRKGWRDGAVEMYDRGRFFTVTGDRYEIMSSRPLDEPL